MNATRSAMTARQWLALGTISLAQFSVATDFSSVYVAMPSIGADLGVEEVNLQWLITAYSLPFASFLLLGGRIVDRLGARRVFILGNIAFGTASILAGLATAGWAIIMGRALQGVAGAFLLPAILSLLSANFPSGPVRARAYSIWGAVGASGLAVGVILGGVLSEASWRLIFLVNIPIALACLWGACKIADASRSWTAYRRIPVVSTTWGTVAVLLVLLTLTYLGMDGADTSLVVTVAVAAVVMLTGFLIHEHRSPVPLVERPLRKIRSLRRGSLAAALYMSSVGTEFFIVTLFLQTQWGYGPFAAGLAFLPLAALVTAGNVAAGRLLRTWTAPRVLMLGFIISAAGLAMIALMLPIGDYWIGLLPGFVVSGLGHGMVYTSMFVLGTSDVPAELSGAAGSLISASQYVSNGIGIAILTIIVAQIAGEAGYSWAFGFNAAVAVAGVLLALTTTARAPEEPFTAEATVTHAEWADT